jgi:hypothetical protein
MIQSERKKVKVEKRKKLFYKRRGLRSALLFPERRTDMTKRRQKKTPASLYADEDVYFDGLDRRR